MGAMDFKPFKNRIYLSSPTMHGDELNFVQSAYDTNWMSTVGENIDVIEGLCSEFIGCEYAVGLTTGTSALHMAIKAAGVKKGDKVFVSDTTFAATVNPIVYEGATPVFIDSEKDTLNMDPIALEKAFQLYPDVKVVVVADLYGTPAKYSEISSICEKYGAVIIEDSAESFGADYKGKKTGSFGKFNVLSFNGNKIITGSSGGVLLTDDYDTAQNVRKWSTQSRDNNSPWYQHSEIGYNYRMSNVIAGIIRGQFPYLNDHIEKKKAIYMRYKEAFKDLPVQMNPYVTGDMEPNFWLSCLLIDKSHLSKETRTDCTYSYEKEQHKSCPAEIYDALEKYNVECRFLWKPMHLQPLYNNNPYITADGLYCDGKCDVGTEIFKRGLCLPCDIKMTEEEQSVIIDIIKNCFE